MWKILLIKIQDALVSPGEVFEVTKYGKIFVRWGIKDGKLSPSWVISDLNTDFIVLTLILDNQHTIHTYTHTHIYTTMYTQNWI